MSSIQHAFFFEVTFPNLPMGSCNGFMENSHLWLQSKKKLHKHVDRSLLWYVWKMVAFPVVNFNVTQIQDKIKSNGILLLRLKRVR